MTDALVEAVARAISGQDDAGWKALPQDDRERLYGGGKWHDSGHTRDDHKQSATAALQAIEAAGYRVVDMREISEVVVNMQKGATWSGNYQIGYNEACRDIAAMLSAAPRVGGGV